MSCAVAWECLAVIEAKFDLRMRLLQICGVDLMRIDGIDVATALVVVSEVGTDMAHFPTVKHWRCWLALYLGSRITGGLSLNSKTRRIGNRAARALRLAAAVLRSSQSVLGPYFGEMCSRMDFAFMPSPLRRTSSRD